MHYGTEAETDDSDSDVNVYCYMVEHCIQRAQHNQVIFCPRHGNLGPYFIASSDGLVHAAHAAPDLVRTAAVCDCEDCLVTGHLGGSTGRPLWRVDRPVWPTAE